MDGLEYQSFSDFLDYVQQLVAPEDLAENTALLFRENVGVALSEIQTLLPLTRRFQLQILTKDDVQEFCAASVFQGPVGKITDVFAYKPGLDCRKFHYARVSPAKIDCWIETQRCVQCTLEPPPTHIYDTPYCNYVIEGQYSCSPPYLTGIEDDCLFKSLPEESRIFSVGPDYKMYCAPRFPCGYYLFVQWQGIRRKWSDTSAVLVDNMIREAVVNRVEKRIAMKEHNFTAAHEFDAEYIVNLRTLKYRYRDEQEAELERDCSAAIERLLPAFMPLYAPSQVPAEICINESSIGSAGDDILES